MGHRRTDEFRKDAVRFSWNKFGPIFAGDAFNRCVHSPIGSGIWTRCS
ncbi:hypothetical protein [Octadecabacter antarcticus]